MKTYEIITEMSDDELKQKLQGLIDKPMTDDSETPRQLKRKIKRIKKDARILARDALNDLKNEVKKTKLRGGDDSDKKQTIQDFMERELGKYNQYSTNSKINTRASLKVAAQVMIGAYTEYLRDKYGMIAKKAMAKEEPTDNNQSVKQRVSSKAGLGPKPQQKIPGTIMKHKGHEFKWLGNQWAFKNPNTGKFVAGKLKNDEMWKLYHSKKPKDIIIPNS